MKVSESLTSREGQGRLRRFCGEASLIDIQLRRVETRQDIPGKKLALIDVRIARENKSPHSHVNVSLQLLVNLVGISHNCTSTTGTRSPNARPDMVLNVVKFKQVMEFMTTKTERIYN